MNRYLYFKNNEFTFKRDINLSRNRLLRKSWIARYKIVQIIEQILNKLSNFLTMSANFSINTENNINTRLHKKLRY